MASSANSSHFLIQRKHGSWTVYGIAIALTIIACAVAVVLRLFSVNDLPFQTFAALIGVIITAIITGVLLKGQSDSERIQKEQSEIFKEKLSTYNNFLTALCAYVTDSTEKNKKALIFYTMAIRMHAKPETVQQFTEKVTEIIRSTGSGDSSEVSDLVKTLSEISQLFHNELYDEKDAADLANTLESFVTAISGSQVEPTEEQKEKDAEAEQKEDEEAVSNSKIQAWDAKIKELASKGWTLENGNDSFALSSKDSPVKISVYRKKGKYVVEATKEGDSDFSQTLKDNFKGSRRYGTWWRELPISNYGVTDGTLLSQLPVNDKARASVIKWIDKLIEIITL